MPRRHCISELNTLAQKGEAPFISYSYTTRWEPNTPGAQHAATAAWGEGNTLKTRFHPSKKAAKEDAAHMLLEAVYGAKSHGLSLGEYFERVKPQTAAPTFQPQAAAPTFQPQTAVPTFQPQTAVPTFQPQTAAPTFQPQAAAPTFQPQTAAPTFQPQTAAPTFQPQTAAPTFRPQTAAPTFQPQIAAPTFQPQTAASTFQLQAAATTFQPQTEAPTFQPQTEASTSTFRPHTHSCANEKWPQTSSAAGTMLRENSSPLVTQKLVHAVSEEQESHASPEAKNRSRQDLLPPGSMDFCEPSTFLRRRSDCSVSSEQDRIFREENDGRFFVKDADPQRGTEQPPDSCRARIVSSAEQTERGQAVPEFDGAFSSAEDSARKAEENFWKGFMPPGRDTPSGLAAALQGPHENTAKTCFRLPPGDGTRPEAGARSEQSFLRPAESSTRRQRKDPRPSLSPFADSRERNVLPPHTQRSGRKIVLVVDVENVPSSAAGFVEAAAEALASRARGPAPQATAAEDVRGAQQKRGKLFVFGVYAEHHHRRVGRALSAMRTRAEALRAEPGGCDVRFAEWPILASARDTADYGCVIVMTLAASKLKDAAIFLATCDGFGHTVCGIFKEIGHCCRSVSTPASLRRIFLAGSSCGASLESDAASNGSSAEEARDRDRRPCGGTPKKRAGESRGPASACRGMRRTGGGPA